METRGGRTLSPGGVSKLPTPNLLCTVLIGSTLVKSEDLLVRRVDT